MGEHKALSESSPEPMCAVDYSAPSDVKDAADSNPWESGKASSPVIHTGIQTQRNDQAILILSVDVVGVSRNSHHRLLYSLMRWRLQTLAKPASLFNWM